MLSPERKAQIEANRAKRQDAAKARAEAHQDLVDDLEDKFSESLGVHGTDWYLINRDNDCSEGPIVLKLGEFTQYKAWQAKPGAAAEDQLNYVLPNVVYPTKEIFNAIVYRRPALLSRATVAQNRLFGNSEEDYKGKV